jgi:thymidylate synthase (FAD)
MKLVTPKVFIIGETRIDEQGFEAMLTEIGVPDWHSDGDSDTEVLVEAAGKLCYMSFDTTLNKNLTKTGTRNNFDYIQQGIIATQHGSVLEHVAVNIVFVNVSRVFTHELVRHRAGASYSQTSGRYVRTDELSFWMPQVIRENVELAGLFEEAIIHQEETIRRMEEVSGINRMKSPADFPKKKQLTSAFRRIVGNGVANNIEATYNHRALRHLCQLRTSRHAEEEIRIGFNLLFEQLSNRYPAIYADATREMVDGHFEVTFQHEKV